MIGEFVIQFLKTRLKMRLSRKENLPSWNLSFGPENWQNSPFRAGIRHVQLVRPLMSAVLTRPLSCPVIRHQSPLHSSYAGACNSSCPWDGSVCSPVSVRFREERRAEPDSLQLPVTSVCTGLPKAEWLSVGFLGRGREEAYGLQPYISALQPYIQPFRGASEVRSVLCRDYGRCGSEEGPI